MRRTRSERMMTSTDDPLMPMTRYIERRGTMKEPWKVEFLGFCDYDWYVVIVNGMKTGFRDIGIMHRRVYNSGWYNPDFGASLFN